MNDPVLFNEFNPVYTAKQTVARRALARDDIKEVLYGGAKGGGKSVFGCFWCLGRALQIIEECEIAERQHHPFEYHGRAIFSPVFPDRPNPKLKP